MMRGSMSFNISLMRVSSLNKSCKKRSVASVPLHTTGAFVYLPLEHTTSYEYPQASNSTKWVLDDVCDDYEDTFLFTHSKSA